jgi:hypothetical protein
VRLRAGAVLTAVAALLLVLLPLPASADDAFEIDGRLEDMGFEGAYSTYLGMSRATRVVVDYRSLSRDQAAYEDEARRIAEVVWENLEVRLLAVDVAPTSGVVWRDGGVPPAVSFPRQELEEAFGPRPARMDERGPWEDEMYGEVDLGPAAAWIGWGLLGVLVVGGAIVAVVLWRGRRRGKADAPDPWTAGWSTWSPGPPGPPGAAAPPGWPPPAAWSGTSAPSPPAGPWAPPESSGGAR